MSIGNNGREDVIRQDSFTTRFRNNSLPLGHDSRQDSNDVDFLPSAGWDTFVLSPCYALCPISDVYFHIISSFHSGQQTDQRIFTYLQSNPIEGGLQQHSSEVAM